MRNDEQKVLAHATLLFPMFTKACTEIQNRTKIKSEANGHDWSSVPNEKG